MKPSSPPTTAAEPSRRPTLRLAESVYENLRDDIFAFRLLPGDRFAENDVADRLQVSRTPVREALMRLQSEGLVRGYFRNGWEVVPIDFSRFAALYDLREMIELHAVRRLCQPGGDKFARARDTLLAEAGTVWRVAVVDQLVDGLAVAALDERFHLMLVAAAGNPETDTVYRQVTEHIRIMRRLDFAYGDCIADTYAEHVAILDAISAGDATRASGLTEQHIKDSHAVVEQITIDRLEQVRTEMAQHPTAAPSRRKRFG